MEILNSDITSLEIQVDGDVSSVRLKQRKREEIK